jgi:hypothetical protein
MPLDISERPIQNVGGNSAMVCMPDGVKGRAVKLVTDLVGCR